MSKTSKAFRALWLAMKNPWLLNRILEEDAVWEKYVREKYAMEGGFPVIRPEALFGDFTETVSPFAFLDGGSEPTDLALLKKLARGIPDCSYFEIGTWRGESVANVAEVARECVTLNLSKEEMASMGLDARYIQQHGMFSKHLPNVRHLEGNTKIFDFSSVGQKFDLIFVDGDHKFDMVRNDSARIFQHLVHDHTVVVWHDYARMQEKIRFEVMAGILEGAPKTCHSNIRHVAHTICAVYFPVDHPGFPKRSLEIPEGFFKIELDYRKIKS